MDKPRPLYGEIDKLRRELHKQDLVRESLEREVEMWRNRCERVERGEHKDRPYDRETVMKQWDKWRRYIAGGGEGSWPRDAFEALLDCFEGVGKDKPLEDWFQDLIDYYTPDYCPVCGEEKVKRVQFYALDKHIGVKRYKIVPLDYELNAGEKLVWVICPKCLIMFGENK